MNPNPRRQRSPAATPARWPRILAALAAVLLAHTVAAQDTRFAYSGQLRDGEVVSPHGSYDFRVRLYADGDVGAPLLGEQLRPAVAVQAGAFAFDLDFGVIVPPHGWLELAVRPVGGETWDTLSPRQPIRNVPSALRAEFVDFTGIENLPAGVQALAGPDTRAPIGELLLPPLTPAPGPGLPLYAASFALNRNIGTLGGTPQPGPLLMDPLELLIDPADVAPELYRRGLTGLVLSEARVRLFGNPVSLLTLGSVIVTRFGLAPGGRADGGTLAQLTLQGRTLRIDAEASEFTWDFQTTTGSAFDPACRPPFERFASGAIPADFNGLIVQPEAALPGVTLPVAGGGGGGGGGSTPQHDAVALRYRGDDSAAARTRLVCAANLMVAGSGQGLDAQFDVFEAGAADAGDWTYRVAWTRLLGDAVEFRLTPGGFDVSLHYLPTEQIRLSTGSGAEFCFNVSQMAACQ